MLSTVNTFPKELSQIIREIEKAHWQNADRISQKLTKVIGEVFKIAEVLNFSNPFTNANKLIDHINVYGKHWADVPLPKTHSCETLSKKLLEKTYELLKENGF